MITYIAGRIGEHILGAALVTFGTILIKETIKEYAKSYHKMKIESERNR